MKDKIDKRLFKKKIFITTTALVGGIGTFLKDFIKIAIKNKSYIKLIVFFSRNSEDYRVINYFIKEFPQIEIVFIDIKSNNIIKKIFEISLKSIIFFKTIFDKKPDIIFNNTTPETLIFIFFKKFFFKSIPLIFQFHGAFSYERYGEEKYFLLLNDNQFIFKKIKLIFLRIKFFVRKFYDFLVYKNVDKIVVFSKYANNFLINNFRINPKKIFLIKPGIFLLKNINVKKINKNLNKIKLGFNNKINLIIIVSRLEPRKGIIEAIKALGYLKNERNDFLSLLISPMNLSFNEYFYNVLFFVNKLKLGKNLMFINNPPPKEIKQLIRAADLLIMPSIDLETFGFVTLEALASATPIIAFDIGANSELIDRNVGFIVDVIQPYALKKKVDYFLNLKKNIKEKMQHECLKKAKSYNWNSYFNNLLKISKIN